MKLFTFTILAAIFVSGVAAQIGPTCTPISNYGVESKCKQCPLGSAYVPPLNCPVCNPVTQCCKGQCCLVIL